MPVLQKTGFNLSIIGLCGLLFYLPDSIQHQLSLQAATLVEGAWWTLLTAHFVHFTPEHLLWNLLGLAAIIIVFYTEQQFIEDLCFISISAVLISLVLYWQQNSTAEYRGLSGLLYGYTVFYGLKAYRINKIFSIAVLLLISGRLIWQHSTGFDVYDRLDSLGGRVSIEAHLYGSVCGWVGFTLLWLTKWRLDKTTSTNAADADQ